MKIGRKMSFKKKREIHFFTTGSPENVNHTLSFSIEKCESHSLLIMNWCITLLTYIELVNHTLYFWSAHCTMREIRQIFPLFNTATGANFGKSRGVKS